MESQKRLLKYVLAYKARLIIAVVLGALMAGCTVLLSFFIKWFVEAGNGTTSIQDMGVVKFGLERGWFQPDQAQWALMWIVAAAIVLIHIPKGIFTYFNAYLVASVTNRVGTDVRQEMYAHLQTLPMLSLIHI